jgi:Leucine-rich repeat (LRR) protein
LTNLEQLNLMQTDITDAGLEHLQGLKNLRVLNLRASLTATVITPHVTDAGLEYLQGLTQLEELDLAFARVTDAGLVRLKKLTRLKKLNLEHVLRTFGAVRVVEGNTVRLKPARDLPTTPETVPADLITDLQQITDAGLVPLQTLTHLTSLDLTGTEVTEAGVKQLRRALPRCQIVWAPRQP